MEFIHEKNRQEAQWVRRAIGRDSQSQISEGKGQNQGCAIKDADGGRAIHNGQIGMPAPMSSTIQQESKKPLGLQSLQGSSGQHQHQNEIAA